jgi:hypothetical protein
MFDDSDSVVGLSELGVSSGEGYEEREADQFAYELTCRLLADGWVDEDRHALPDLDSIPPGLFLFAVLASVDRSKLNGFDLVRLLQSRERLVSHCQAGGMADAVEMSYASPGDSHSPPERTLQSAEFAADELRAALTLTRRGSDVRLSLACDVRERLPRVWDMFDAGSIDLARVRVIADGTAHLTEQEARDLVDEIAERASKLTTGQLARWIRRLCVESEPEKAKDRYETATGQRRLWIEETPDGTGNVHLFDIPIEDAAAIGKRVNAHMISLRRDGDTRSHDNLRADIARDMLLGADPTNRGRGVFDMRVPMTVLAGLEDRAAEIPGLGPVIADIARKFADLYPRSEWRATITDDHGNVAGIVTTTRRPTKELSRYIEATQPTCSFMGCLMPARECDFDHLLPRSMGGETSSDNGGPKCRHDHILKDHGWTHQHINGVDIWTSPLGHTYQSEKPP